MSPCVNGGETPVAGKEDPKPHGSSRAVQGDSRASMCSILTLLLLAIGVPRVNPQTILQSPESVVQGPGSTASLRCFLEGSSNPNLYWYRQIPGGQLEQLSYSIGTGSSNDAWPDHLKGTRPDDKNFNLEITNLRSNDTAVYYCAWSLTLGQVNASP